MKRLFICLIVVLLTTNVYAGVWRSGDGSETPTGSDNINNLDTIIDGQIVQPIDLMLQDYREGVSISYASASTLTAGAGQLMVENSDGSIRLMLSNDSSTSIGWSDIDTGAEANNTYYVYGIAASSSATAITFKISLSSSAPTGETFYKRLGSFVNSGGNILNDESITNDNNYYALQLGDWVSKSFGTNYLASTDGFLTAYATGQVENVRVDCITDSSSSPSTVRSQNQGEEDSGETERAGCSTPVKKGDYYKATRSSPGSLSGAMFFLPLQ